MFGRETSKVASFANRHGDYVMAAICEENEVLAKLCLFRINSLRRGFRKAAVGIASGRVCEADESG